ncbi:DUF1488 family protein [Chitinasiproducens palmae]|uniref:DUF1488 family protein n=1 Tax=Chitinasiproducens palmae TaxID=1770053 RepID=A0A1H2PVZ4_9BURK|nr:DUF1488 family protein [Chitinasiproducens palmae]SDV51486.1 Protein of unknown function [Chitinasiproducens palmae]
MEPSGRVVALEDATARAVVFRFIEAGQRRLGVISCALLVERFGADPAGINALAAFRTHESAIVAAARRHAAHRSRVVLSRQLFED